MRGLLCKNFSELFFRLKRFSTKPYILGIETSCDDTGVAVVDGDGKILGESLKSQQHLTSRFGGVVPLIAARQHEINLQPALLEALTNSQLTLEDIDAVSVTINPGLVVCLRHGINFALDLCRKAKKPLITVHHMKAHALTARWTNNVQYPFMCLLISGGHALITWVKSVDEFLIIGQNDDNAPGEVLDKVARRLKLINIEPDNFKLSGGALVERVGRTGDPFAFDFSQTSPKVCNCNFYFAGIYSTIFKRIDTLEAENSIVADDVLPNCPDICASAQHSIFKQIARRIMRAFEYVKCQNWATTDGGYPKTLVVSGGVASNKYIRNGLEYVAAHFDCSAVFPPAKFCTDNGVMIAWNGLEKFKSNIDVLTNIPDTIYIHAKVPIGEDLTPDVQSKRLKGQRFRHLKSVDLKKNFYFDQKCERKIVGIHEQLDLLINK